MNSAGSTKNRSSWEEELLLLLDFELNPCQEVCWCLLWTSLRKNCQVYLGYFLNSIMFLFFDDMHIGFSPGYDNQEAVELHWKFTRRTMMTSHLCSKFLFFRIWSFDPSASGHRVFRSSIAMYPRTVHLFLPIHNWKMLRSISVARRFSLSYQSWSYFVTRSPIWSTPAAPPSSSLDQWTISMTSPASCSGCQRPTAKPRFYCFASAAAANSLSWQVDHHHLFSVSELCPRSSCFGQNPGSAVPHLISF